MDCDVLIAGGGPGGAATALCLSRRGIRTVVIDRGRDGFRGGEALPPAAVPILGRLGLEPALHGGPHLPCYANQSAWGGAELGETDFLRSPWGHGWHLDRGVFDRQVLAAARDAGARVVCGARITDATRRQRGRDGAAGWEVTWRDTEGRIESGHCRWLVDASGRARVLARRQRSEILRLDRQVARIGTFGLDDTDDGRDPDTRTLIEADEHGWWYTARVPGGLRMVIYFSDPDLPPLPAMVSPAAFVGAVGRTRHIYARVKLHGYRLVGEPITRAASTTRLTTVAGPGWVAVGDAALSFDPLSAQGVTTALRFGEQAALALGSALDGDAGGLDRYAASVDTQWSEYRSDREVFYRMEHRWPEHPFWRRRRGFGGDDSPTLAPRRTVSPSTDRMSDR